MNLDQLETLAERLRTESIGDPQWIESKHAFEYEKQTIEVAVVLKIVRAAQGVHALNILCEAGLFVDMGAIYRCVGDCSAEVYFLLEKYPKQSKNVQKFLREFYSKTIDGHLTSTEESVQANKIQSAMIRSLTGQEQDEELRKIIVNIYKTFSGYTHAGYSHIMQMYGGTRKRSTFNIPGIPSRSERDRHMQLVLESRKSLLYVMAYVATTFGLPELHRDIMKYR